MEQSVARIDRKLIGSLLRRPKRHSHQPTPKERRTPKQHSPGVLTALHVLKSRHIPHQVCSTGLAEAFFPSLINMINEADFEQMGAFLKKHAAPTCVVSTGVRGMETMGPEFISLLYQAIREYHPDGVCCVTSLAAYGDEIKCIFVFKSTDSRRITELVCASGKREEFAAVYENKRDLLVQYMDFSQKTDEEAAQIRKLMTSAEDVTIHGWGVLTAHLDPKRERIVRYETRTFFGSVQPA